MLDKNLRLQFVEIVEKAAIHCAPWMGKGEDKAADAAAVEAMRSQLNELPMKGRVVIGEGERDDAPMLFIGEIVGSQRNSHNHPVTVDIAVDPCEGTSLVATGQPGALAVIAASEEGGLFSAPDFYMKKLAAPPAAKGKVDLRYSPSQNIQILSECLRRSPNELVITIQDRPRHRALIQEVRATGARVRLFGEGDVAAAIACAFSGNSVHAFMGIGGAPEGVITAAAMRCLGAHFQGQLIYDPETVNTGLIGNSKEANQARLKSMGILDPDKIYEAHELASGKNVVFAACGITDGPLLEGVRFFNGGLRTHSVVISSKEKTIRFVDTIHMLENTQESIELRKN